MCASGGARLVGAIGAVAIVVIELLDFELDGRIRDANECLGILVVFGDCVTTISIYRPSTRTIPSQLRSFGDAIQLETYTLGLRPVVWTVLRRHLL